MAVHAPITGAPSRASEIHRRHLLRGLGVASLFAASGAARADPGANEQGHSDMNMHSAIAFPSLQRKSSVDWDRAMAAFHAASKVSDDYDRDIWRPIYEEVQRIAPRPCLHFTVNRPYGGEVRYDMWPAEMNKFDDHWSPDVQEKAAAVKAAWAKHKEARDRLNFDAAADESERLTGIQCAREGDLLRMPSPHLAAFWWKLDRLFGEGADRAPGEEGAAWCGEWMDALMADAKRLLHPTLDA